MYTIHFISDASLLTAHALQLKETNFEDKLIILKNEYQRFFD